MGKRAGVRPGFPIRDSDFGREGQHQMATKPIHDIWRCMWWRWQYELLYLPVHDIFLVKFHS